LEIQDEEYAEVEEI